MEAIPRVFRWCSNPRGRYHDDLLVPRTSSRPRLSPSLLHGDTPIRADCIASPALAVTWIERYSVLRTLTGADMICEACTAKQVTSSMRPPHCMSQATARSSI
jgi:hypothetical protein